MAYEIVKAVPGDFPALTTAGPDAEVLEVQIDAAVSSAECVGILQASTATWILQFDVQPSTADLTAINNVCNSHTGAPFVRGAQKHYVEGVQTETGTAYVNKVSVVSGLLAGGDYLLTWYCELSVATADSTSGALARVLWGGVERAESSNNLTFYQSFSGSVIIAVAPLETPAIAMQLRRAGTANTAQIRRIRFAIAPLQNG